MTGPRPNRRRFLQTTATITGIGFLGATSGCLGVFDGEQSGSGRIEKVPDGMAFALHVDVDGMLTDEQIRSTIDETLSVFPRAPDSVSSVLDEVESKTGLDPRGVGDVLTFGAVEDASFGSVAWTDYSIDELQSATDETNLEEEKTTYGGKTVYRSESGSSDGALAVLEDGTYAAGTNDVVEDVIDVWNGDADPIQGEVREAYQSTQQGYVRVGFDVPSEAVPAQASGEFDFQTFEDVQFGYGSYSVDGEHGTARLSFRAGSTDGAEDLKSMVDAGLVMAEQQLENRESTPRSEMERALIEDVTAAIEETSVSRDGTTVTITNSRGTMTVAILVPAVVASFVLGLGGQTRPVAPQIAFSFDYDSDANAVTVTHDGGDTVKRSELYLRGTGFRTVSGVDQTASGVWQGSASGTNGGEPAVVAGDSVTLGVDPDYDVRVVFQSDAENVSATLAADTGPEE